MKHTPKILTLFGALLISSSAWAVDASYYTSLNGQSGANLFNAIHTVANNGFKQLSYDDLWAAYEKTDLYPAGHANAGKIWDMYGGCDFTYSTNQCGNYAAECDCYNREHSIPKSWFCDCTTGMGADLFHLVPTDGKVNGKRGNFAFGEVASATYTYDNSKLGSAKNVTITNTVLGSSFTTSSVPGTVFEPDDEYKGDFARGYFGTMIKWTTVYPTMSSDDGAWFFNNTYTEAGHFGLADYGIALLMKWHRQDPVSQKEIDRNNGIQATQRNRNPFIDYPCLAEYLWGDKAGETFSTTSCCGSFEANFSVGSDGCTACATSVNPSTPTITVSRTPVDCGSVVVGNTTTATFTVSGSNLTADITLEVTTGTDFSIDQTTLAPTDGTVAATTITVTFAPTAAGEQDGTITISSTGATNKTVSLRAVGTTAAVAPAPSTTPVVFFGTVVTDKHTFSGTPATLHLHISDLATDVTVASSDPGIFTVSTSTATNGTITITPDEAAAGVTITLTRVAAGTANLTIEGGVVNKTYEITFQ